VILAGAGTLAWHAGAVAGLRWVAYEAPLGMALLGFVIGAGAFFAPCAFVLFPAYVSYYVSVAGGGIRHALPLGLACAAGAITFFAAVGMVIAAVGGGIAPYLLATKPFVALVVVGLGVVQLLDVRLPAVAGGAVTRIVPGRSVPVTLFAYGFGYGLASTGCTLPLYVSITVLPLTSGFSGAAAAAFTAFALAIAVLMLTTTLLVAAAKQQVVEALQRSAIRIKRASGVVLILAGLYLLYFYVRAGI
jgi:cytochrome c-type biogenesis protein